MTFSLLQSVEFIVLLDWIHALSQPETCFIMNQIQVLIVDQKRVKNKGSNLICIRTNLYDKPGKHPRHCILGIREYEVLGIICQCNFPKVFSIFKIYDQIDHYLLYIHFSTRICLAVAYCSEFELN